MNLAIRPYFLGILVIAFIAFGIERLIVTDKEAIQALGEDLAEAIQKEDYERLEGLLDSGFSYGARDRTETIGYVRAQYRKLRPINVEVHLFEIHVEEDTARATCAVTGMVMGRPGQMQVYVTLARTPEDEWVLKSVEGGTGGLPR